MTWGKRIKANWVWGLFSAIIWDEWHQPRKMALLLGSAALTALVFSLFDAANERWPKPLRWPKLLGRKRKDGSA